MDVLFGGLKNLLLCVSDWVSALVSLPLDLPVGLLIGLFFVILLWMFSGVWAADIAELRGYRPHKHLWIGLILPFIYPALLLAILKPVEGSQVDMKRNKDAAKLRKEAEIQAQKQAEIAAKEEQRQMEDADPTLWSKSRMERIAFNADGTPAGPFLCTLDDGQQFYVISIQSIMDQVVILQLADENGTAGPVLRFPYARITGMEIVEA